MTNNWIAGFLGALAETLALAEAIGVEPARFFIEVVPGPDREGLDVLVYGTGRFAPYLARVQEGSLKWDQHPGVRVHDAGASGAGEWHVILAHLGPQDEPLAVRKDGRVVFLFNADGSFEELRVPELLARLDQGGFSAL